MIRKIKKQIEEMLPQAKFIEESVWLHIFPNFRGPYRQVFVQRMDGDAREHAIYTFYDNPSILVRPTPGRVDQHYFAQLLNQRRFREFRPLLRVKKRRLKFEVAGQSFSVHEFLKPAISEALFVQDITGIQSEFVGKFTSDPLGIQLSGGYNNILLGIARNGRLN